MKQRKLPDESVLEKLKKIARLAEQGYKGEAETARRLLEKQLAEYGLTIEDILDDAKQTREFRYSNKQEFRLFMAVIVHHFGGIHDRPRQQTRKGIVRRINRPRFRRFRAGMGLLPSIPRPGTPQDRGGVPRCVRQQV